MKIVDRHLQISNKNNDNNFKASEHTELTVNIAIEFANWIQLNGWYYGLNGNYYNDVLFGPKLQMTPQDLFAYYKNEKQL